MLPCFVQNFKTILQMQWIFMRGVVHKMSIRWILDIAMPPRVLNKAIHWPLVIQCIVYVLQQNISTKPKWMAFGWYYIFTVTNKMAVLL